MATIVQSTELQDTWFPEGHLLIDGQVYASTTRLNPANWATRADIVTVEANPDGAGFKVSNLISQISVICVREIGVRGQGLGGRVVALSDVVWKDTLNTVDCAVCIEGTAPPYPADAEAQRKWIHEAVTASNGVIVTPHGWFTDTGVTLRRGAVTGNCFFFKTNTGEFHPAPKV